MKKLILLFGVILLTSCMGPKIDVEEEYPGAIVLKKQGSFMTMKYKGEVIHCRTFGIYYNKYNEGDTIKTHE